VKSADLKILEGKCLCILSFKKKTIFPFVTIVTKGRKHLFE